MSVRCSRCNALYDELDIESTNSPLTARAITIIRQIVDKGAVMFQTDDSTEDYKTIEVLKEVANNHDWFYHQSGHINYIVTNGLEVK